MCKKLCKVKFLLFVYIVKFGIYTYNVSIRLEAVGAGKCQFNFPTFFVVNF